MKTIDRFISHISNGESSFIIDGKSGQKIMCFCAMIGKARFVYANYSYGSVTNIDKMELTAIVVDKTVYIVSGYIFDVWRDTGLPENVVMFDEAIKDFTCRAESYLHSFYDGLPTEEMEEGYEDSLRQNARRYIFCGKGQPELELDQKFLSENDVKDILAGFTDFEGLVIEKLEADRKHWISVKAGRTSVENMMNNPNTVKPYEVKISAALNSVAAKTVKVEFEMNGITAAGKVDPQEIIRMMINDDYFSSYNFFNRREGETILKKLGATTWRRDSSSSVLTCDHITRITYGKKELYRKQ